MRSEASQLYRGRCEVRQVWLTQKIARQLWVLQLELIHPPPYLPPKCGDNADRKTRIRVKRSWLENARDAQWSLDLRYGTEKIRAGDCKVQLMAYHTLWHHA